MTQQIINIGSVADDGTGDKLRPAFDKTNQNFTELYTTISRRQRMVTSSPIVLSATDQIINCRIPTPATCALPLSATRVGVPLTFKDFGFAAANNITITPAPGETIDGLASVKLTANYQAITLVPLNDGTSTGWAMT